MEQPLLRETRGSLSGPTDVGEAPPWRRPASLKLPRGRSKSVEFTPELEVSTWHPVPSTMGDMSPLRWKAPLVRRQALRRQRPRYVWAALPGNAAYDAMMSMPFSSDCMHCNRQLSRSEGRNTGLCDTCYNTCVKDCSVCKTTLPLKQLQWGSGLCYKCFEACDKFCKICSSDLSNGQLHWGTGLCDMCYNGCEKTCKMCQSRLGPKMLRWGSGLCDPCYNSCQKVCRICQERLQVRQLRWSTGLCDTCYDESDKVCRSCSSHISLGSMHYRTGLCDTCYDKCEKLCKVCKERLDAAKRLQGTGLCDACYGACERACRMCHLDINSEALHWGTGLCDKCYNDCAKICRICSSHIQFGQLHWGSGLCDSCYTGCEKTCRMCRKVLPLGQLHWGTRLCDGCFDSCMKTCSRCNQRVDFGELHWGTGLCDKCYDEEKAMVSSNLSRGVQATIGAQLVFYMAPGMLQPSLFLQIKAAGYPPDAATAYAAVLTAASVASMLFPVPLGLWAERRGEREVYYGIALAGALAALVLASLPPAPVFALAWALLTGPPAIRGVRAAYFAKHVPPEELSRAAQLASTAGLTGGFLGPVLSTISSRLLGSGQWPPNGFAGGALFAAICATLCSATLAAFIPQEAKRKRRNRGGGGIDGSLEQCERCCRPLTQEERKYFLALCDTCYDNYAGSNINFRIFRRRVLLGFSLIAMLMEVSMNAGIVATFQPIVVGHFHWRNDAIATVNVCATGLSVVISFVMAYLRLKERVQTAAAAVLYVSGVVIYTAQPLREWRLVLGLMLGVKAQILFMAPFTAIFSRIIGRLRVTNRLTTALCLAPAIGAALGTTAAPTLIALANTPFFMLASLPAIVAATGIVLSWRRLAAQPIRPQGSPER